jgi:hypothetical protein
MLLENRHAAEHGLSSGRSSLGGLFLDFMDELGAAVRPFERERWRR